MTTLPGTAFPRSCTTLALLLLTACLSAPLYAQETDETVRLDVYTPGSDPTAPAKALICPGDVAVGSEPLKIDFEVTTTSPNPVQYTATFSFSNATLDATVTSDTHGNPTAVVDGGTTTYTVEGLLSNTIPFRVNVVTTATAVGPAETHWEVRRAGVVTQQETCTFNVIADGEGDAGGDLALVIEAIQGALAFDSNAKMATLPLGDEVTICVRVTNNGPDEATDVVITGGADPAFFELQGVTLDQNLGSCLFDQTGGFFSCSGLTLAAGASVKVDVSGVGVAETEEAGFSASTGHPDDPDFSNNDAFITISVGDFPVPRVFTVSPASVTVPANESVEFDGYDCPENENGEPDFGPDGSAGTDDDDCVPVPPFTMWSVSSGIGDVNPAMGSSTTFTAANLAAGETRSGAVIARIGEDSAFANIVVEGPPGMSNRLYLSPETATVLEGEMQDFSAFDCPLDVETGNPDVGDDGIPGTSDDACTPKGVTFLVSGTIGTVSPTTGPTTTLSATLPEGSTSETGQVIATSDDQTESADVTVVRPGIITGTKFVETIRQEGGIVNTVRPRNGVVIELVNRNTGEVFTTTTNGTDADGNDLGRYQFAVPEGDYFVREVAPDGFRQVFPLNTTGEPTVHDVTIAPGEFANLLDFVNLRLFSISGRKFLDENGNGVRDAEEEFVNDWPVGLARVSLDGESEIVAQTMTRAIDGAPGSYRFENLDPGFYIVREALEPGIFPTAPFLLGFWVVFIGPDAFNLDFGNRPSDVILVDDNGDGEGLREQIEACNARGPEEPLCELIEEVVLKRASKQERTIRLDRPLPPITRPLVLRGGGSLILDGSALGDDAHGLVITAGGTDVSGLTITGFSGHGVLLDGEGRNRLTNNTITANGGDGIRVASGAPNLLFGNRIYANGGLAVDVGADGPTPNAAGEQDGMQSHPVLTAVTTDADATVVTGMLASTPDAVFTLEIFAGRACIDADRGEGEIFLGPRFVFTDSLGQASFTVRFDTVFAERHFITATATSPDGHTSEFSPCDAVVATGNEQAPPVEIPAALFLYGNYPNPFNPETTIRFDLPEAAGVRVEVYDLLGRLALTLPPQPLDAGAGRTLGLDASSLSSGVYLYRIVAETATRTLTATGHFVLMK